MTRRERESMISWIVAVVGFVVGFSFHEQIFALFGA